MQLFLFNYQVLQFRARVDLGAMAMKGCSAFPNAPASLEPHYQIVGCHIQDTHRGYYPSTEMQSVYSTAPADWAKFPFVNLFPRTFVPNKGNIQGLCILQKHYNLCKCNISL